MAPPEVSSSTATGLEKSSSAEAYRKGFTMTVMNTLKNLKDDTNKCLNERRKDRELNEIMKASQDMKVEFKQTEPSGSQPVGRDRFGGQMTLSWGSPKTILLIRYLHCNL